MFTPVSLKVKRHSCAFVLSLPSLPSRILFLHQSQKSLTSKISSGYRHEGTDLLQCLWTPDDASCHGDGSIRAGGVALAFSLRVDRTVTVFFTCISRTVFLLRRLLLKVLGFWNQHNFEDVDFANRFVRVFCQAFTDVLQGENFNALLV